jgi:rhombotail lipoprotein
MVDAAVYDIDSEELLFRSEATSNVQGDSASAFVAEELRTRSQYGFELAIDELSKILDWDLYQFKQKVKKNEVAVKVSYRSGGGGGAISLDIFLLPLIFSLRYFRRMSHGCKA